MQDMNLDKIGDELAKAYEDGYKKGLEENKILTDGEKRKFELLQKQVLEWGDEKGITHSENIDKQFMKFIEEVFEFKTELDTHLLVNNFTKAIPDENLKLEMGDIFVTLIILAKQLDLNLTQCLEKAYKKIQYRKGKTIDGTFVKSEDL